MNQTVIYHREAPSITIFLFAYNQEKYVQKACEAVLAQDYQGHLEIIFSDDCSRDNTFQIMSKIAKNYTGTHVLRLNRNPHNMGLIPHINLIHQLATGELLIVAAGDDISLANRVSEIVEAYRQAEQQPTSIHSSVYKMSPEGEVLDIWIPPIHDLPKKLDVYALSSSLLIGATHAWHKSLFDRFGDIQQLGAYEDLVLAYRSALLNGLVYIDKPLVNYRLGVGISGAGKQEAQDNKDPQIFKGKLLSELKIKIPVLKQRLIDSKHIQAPQNIITLIQDEIYRSEIQKKLLTEEGNFFQQLYCAISVSFMIYFLRVWFRWVRKGLR
ncbi:MULTISPECIES: glycosyltransferase [Acinetobacter]|uniref:Glycosyltransferase n=1 Tax=Acinetobacter corruptisaponis TaxID=3045147 RepID=A0ABY8S0Q5_9GAMM|nr:glycosyltransferase [Acinetobacter sp. KCTC 92772]WHP04866.1 glycosyltransferase [Acinetobacter sp. KCTC 92772]